MQQLNFDQVLEAITRKDSRYHADAYHFVREALDHTQRAANKVAKGVVRHVSGQELLEGIRSYAIEKYGPMAVTVLNEWGVTRGEDFGEIVFNMVETRLLSKTEKDTREDFAGGYSFQDAFVRPFIPDQKLKKTASASATHSSKP